MKPSTKAFFKLHGWRKLVDFIHGYIYGRWPNRYLRIITGSGFRGSRKTRPHSPGPRVPRPQGRVSRWFAERYHSKVLTHGDAARIIRLDRPIIPENPEKVVPFDIANRIVLDAPGSLAVMRCPCRETRGEKSCGPLEVCMVIGSPFVEFVVEHGTNGARPLDRDEAVEILEECRERGWVHTAWFKDAMGGRFYAICNCCSCCCIGLRAMRKSGYEARSVIPSGYVAEVGNDICSRCGKCEVACPFGAIIVGDGSVIIHREKCFGCGVCETLCPDGLLKMVLAPEKGAPFDVEAMD